MSYLCSTPYNPTGERGLSPLDPALALPWSTELAATLSEKDASAPTLAEAADLGLLPTWDACSAWYLAMRG
jgi:hypothetical protein